MIVRREGHAGPFRFHHWTLPAVMRWHDEVKAILVLVVCFGFRFVVEIMILSDRLSDACRSPRRPHHVSRIFVLGKNNNVGNACIV